MQDQAFANTLCARQAGGEKSQPFGPDADVWKVGGKIFAVTSAQGTVVKTDSLETAALVIEMGRAMKAPYFHASWMLLPHGQVPDEELAERVATSYALIRASLPKRVQSTLG
ncbi:MmcQ/YjbR family DNA-binding protein [Rhodobacter sp. SY28-1]|uniref:MmcQ/YjbR family DNA-binding protein n=1 Tax=Rhodobacter sp. SY28-1 TaxID=2562317 RepID=UPI0010C0FB34|nr:MmcQ/YjbR family DNA-binding protein [Rhodobacter sp. SY28-1]